MKTSSVQPRIKLSENHRRSISVSLQLLDQALCEWDDWSKGRVRKGVIYPQEDTFSSQEKNELQCRIANVRHLILRLRDDLQLDAKIVATSQSIVGQAAVLWEMLTGLNTQGLQGYGRVPEDLSRYLDPIGDKLAEEMNEVAKLFSQPTTGAADPDVTKK
jgi:hypothetical protein